MQHSVSMKYTTGDFIHSQQSLNWGKQQTSDLPKWSGKFTIKISYKNPAILDS